MNELILKKNNEDRAMTNEINKNELAPTEITFLLPTTEKLGQLKTMDENFSLTMKYKSADEWAAIKDIDLRCFFMGMKAIPNEDGESVNCGIFVTEKECFLAGGMTLIEAVKNLPPQTPIAITYKGKKKNASSDGSTMIFEVKTLA